LDDETQTIFFYEVVDGHKKLINVSTLYNVVYRFLLLLELLYITFEESDYCESIFAH